jgi:dipeptidyl aminopeptidase/acylaminoacyl peptidase
MNDFTSTIRHDAPDSPESKLVGGSIQENKDRVACANPITNVSADAAPILIVHSRLDEVVPVNQAELLHEALRRVRADVTLRIVEGAGHDFDAIHDEAVVTAFFNRYLRP